MALTERASISGNTISGVLTVIGLSALVTLTVPAVAMAQTLQKDSPQRDRVDRERVLVVVRADEPNGGNVDSFAGWLTFAISSRLEAYESGFVVSHRAVQRFLRVRELALDARLADAQIAELAVLTQAGTLVAGVCSATADSIRLTLRGVSPTTGDELWPATVVVAPTDQREAVVDAAVQHLAATLSSSVNAGYSRMPTHSRASPSLAAYRLFEEGLRLAADGQLRQALRQLDAAVAADSTFISAQTEALYWRWRLYDLAGVDSMLRQLGRRDSPLVARERIEVDFARADRADDVEAGLTAARRYAAYVPEDQYPLALFALRGNYLHEALKAFQSTPRTSPFRKRASDHWSQYVRTLHMLGRYEDEQAEAAYAAVLFPDARATAWYQVRALIGQGRIGEALRLHREIEPLPEASTNARIGLWGNTVRELRAHGAPDFAAPILTHIIRALEGLPPAARQERRALLATHYELAGRWTEAEALTESLLMDTPVTAWWRRKNLLTSLGCIATARNNPRAARGRIGQLDSLRPTAPAEGSIAVGAAIDVSQATVLACLGERERAVALLERGLRASGAPGYGFGYGCGPWLHRDVLYEKLRGFEPFERLIRARH